MESISKNLFILAVDKRIPVYQKDFALRISELFANGDQRVLYKLYEDVCAKKSPITTVEQKLKAVIIGEEDYEVTLSDNLTEKIGVYEFKTILKLIADCYCDILPLGSVIDLNKDFLSKAFDVDKFDSIRFIITQRFAYEEGMESYFTYGAVAYPFGSLISKRLLYFTPPLIEQVVHRGYSDQQEEIFVGVVKNELIVNRGLFSAGFSSNTLFPSTTGGE
ncbi:MAG: DUF4176 domain-containing protein [Firmicutes bacterium]|nr:DUF4176 domain-containing protein [Bacillota bacterium]